MNKFTLMVAAGIILALTFMAVQPIAGQLLPSPCEDQPFTPIDGGPDTGPQSPCRPDQDRDQAPVCEPGFLDIFQCSLDGNVEQLYQAPDCSTAWFFNTSCAFGCTNGSCNAAPCRPGFLDIFQCSLDGNEVEQAFQNENCSIEFRGIETCTAGCAAGFCNEPTSCTPGYINEFQCANDFILQQQFQFSDCRTSWFNVLFCHEGCANSTCIPAPPACNTHFLDEYQCRGSDLQRKHQFPSCETSFVTVQHCPFGCSSGACKGPPEADSCKRGFLDEFRCSGDFLQQRHRSADCSTRWVNVRACAFGCSGNQCRLFNGTTPPANRTTGSAGRCEVDIDHLAFSTLIRDNEDGFASAEVTNRGSASSNVVVTLSTNTGEAETTRFALGAGATRSVAFTFGFDAGQYVMTLEAEATCGGQAFNDIEVFRLEVLPTRVRSPFVPPEPPTIEVTSVEFRPSRLDTELFKSRVVEISIESTPAQDFTIDVAGVPEEWLEFTSLIPVRGSDKAFVFITPTKTGAYTLDIAVEAESGQRFSHQVAFFVARPRPVITGFFLLEELRDVLRALAVPLSSPAALLAVLGVAALLLLLAAALKLREERPLGHLNSR